MASWTFLLVISLVSAGVFVFFFPRTPAADTAEGGEAAAVTLGVGAAGSVPLVTHIDPSLGPADADHVIIEYGDYGCPYCGEATAEIRRLIEAQDGRVRFVWKDMPTPLYFGSDIAAEAAQCAKDQGRFWEFQDALFEEAPPFDSTEMSLLANELGLDITSFTRCLSEREKKPLVERSVAEGQALGIDSVPYFFIDGERHAGRLTYEQLEDLLD